MRVLCTARHRFIGEHFARYFAALGLETRAAVGMDDAAAVAAEFRPEVAVFDYDLLATIPLDDWERDPLLGTVPVVAVSLTRRPQEAHLLDVNGIAGFLYLPTLGRDDARRVIAAACRARGISPPPLPWPALRESAPRR